MLKIQELLYQTENYTSINLSDYVSELINEFKRSYPEVSNQVKTFIYPLSFNLPSKTALHLGLIITEILLNSIKHAYPFTLNYTLEINLDRKDHESFLLQIQDNGKGFDFFEQLKSNSLGLPLIYDLVKDEQITTSFPDKKNNRYQFLFSAPK